MGIESLSNNNGENIEIGGFEVIFLNSTISS